ncbi:hypothetical protein SAMN05421803_103459 [Nocardiopsis flavescens]|uniref:Uncharacterized protein n=1 Tax=Nocardiopsis flavescens TaxID=758803 RepID=A0A1M6GM42_9ACTN|nr:hypothetical protein [Nocardiopsis flavescens]SHJ11003.1 hypothetical protein SAMN05421803_103459 [Nocardiopsis flavescens]
MDTQEQQRIHPETKFAPDAEISLLAMLSACRRRGLRAERDPGVDDGVVVSHTSHEPRVVTLRLMSNRWYRPASDQGDQSLNVGARGTEDMIARHLVTELTGAP